MDDNLINDITLVGQVGQVTVVLKPIKEVSLKYGYSQSYIRRLCNEGQLIAHKLGRNWFVEEHLSQVESLTTLQDTG